jgi:hypothetical protein
VKRFLHFSIFALCVVISVAEVYSFFSDNSEVERMAAPDKTPAVPRGSRSTSERLLGKRSSSQSRSGPSRCAVGGLISWPVTLPAKHSETCIAHWAMPTQVYRSDQDVVR